MTTWTVFRRLVTSNYPQKRNFIAYWQMKACLMRNTNMLKMYGILLI